MLYLVEVFKRPTNREINIIPLLFAAVDTMKRALFRVMKEILRHGVSLGVTREEAERLAAEKLYRPIKVVAKQEKKESI